jgi:hypothetical protein
LARNTPQLSVDVSPICEERNDSAIDHQVPTLQYLEARNNAVRRVPILLCLYRLWRAAQAQAGRLLCLLLLRFGTLSPRAGRTLSIILNGRNGKTNLSSLFPRQLMNSRHRILWRLPLGRFNSPTQGAQRTGPMSAGSSAAACCPLTRTPGRLRPHCGDVVYYLLTAKLKTTPGPRSGKAAAELSSLVGFFWREIRDFASPYAACVVEFSAVIGYRSL